jgi:hypothetical protein
MVANEFQPHAHPIPNAAKLAKMEKGSRVRVGATFLPLEQITRPNLTTEEAAFYLNRAQQTLRLWACSEDGWLRPLRVNGRLAWPVAELRRVLGV